jgi:hypothetical protein
MTLQVHTRYNESGVTFSDNVDSVAQLNQTYRVQGSVNVNILGIYTLTYTVSDLSNRSSSVTRIVRIVDSIPPDVALIGDHVVYLEAGSTYTELGVVCYDNYDRTINISRIDGTFTNTQRLGNYSIVYTAIDRNNNTGSVTRLVVIRDTTPPVHGSCLMFFKFVYDQFFLLLIDPSLRSHTSLLSMIVLTSSLMWMYRSSLWLERRLLLH